MLYGLSVRLEVISGVGAITATILLAWSLLIPPDRGRLGAKPLETRLLVIVLIFGAFGASGWFPSFFGPTTADLEVLPGIVWITLGVAAYLLRKKRTRMKYVGITVLVFALSGITGLIHVDVSGKPDIDVFHIHVEAANAIASGLNPYTGVVEVESTSLMAQPGEVISGYGYPPVTAIGYAVGEWLLADPRFVSLISWLAVLAVLGVAAIRRTSNRYLYVMLIMASTPGWPLVLRASWTEPLTLMFAAVALLVWRRPVASGLGAGLAFASKQYFAVVTPLLLLHRDEYSRRRWLVAVGIVAATVGSALLLDVSAYWSATVEVYASTGPRLDSTNIIGLLALSGVIWDPPFWLPLSLGMAAAVVFGRQSRTPRTLFAAMAVSLSVSFLVSAQGFANYWFLIFGLCALALSVPPEADMEQREATTAHDNRSGVSDK